MKRKKKKRNLVKRRPKKINNAVAIPLRARPSAAQQRSEALAELHDQQQSIRDHVILAAQGHTTGYYLCGPPGTGKSHLVEETLDSHSYRKVVRTGYMTDAALFDLLERNRQRVVVLDDIAATFRKPISLQMLQAALGDKPSGRVISYSTQGNVRRCRFTGSVICISNLPLRNDPVVDSIKDRIPYMAYDPTPEQMEAMILELATKGWHSSNGDLSPVECREVAEFLISECSALETRLDLRLYNHKALPKYLAAKLKHIHTRWRDAVRSDLHSETVLSEPLGREARKIQYELLAKNLIDRFESYEEQCQGWEQMTGTSHRTFSRIKARLRPPDKLTI